MGSNRSGRFTAWFSGVERLALEREAREQDSTINWIVRRAVRRYLGPQKLRDAAESVDQQVAEVTRNNG